MSAGTITLLVLTAFALVALLSLRPGRSAGGESPQKRPWTVDWEQVVKAATPILAAVSLMIGLIEFSSSQREKTASEERAAYLAATQSLSVSGVGAHIAGIASLAQMAEENVERTWLMTESVSAFIRYNSHRIGNDPGYHGPRPRAPYAYPPCPNERTTGAGMLPALLCGLSIKAADVDIQAATEALSFRNQNNETSQNAPPRFRAQLQAISSVDQCDEDGGRRLVLQYIERDWHSKRRNDGGRQLVNEIQYPIFCSFKEIMRRPWLRLSTASLVGVRVGAPFLQGADLSDADISFSSMPDASLARSDMSRAWAVDASLFHADLRGASLEYVDARGTDFGRARLNSAWLSGGTFAGANFWEANLSDAYLVWTDMTDIETMSGANLEKIIAYRADFARARIAGDGGEETCMIYSQLQEANFVDAHLEGVDLRGSKMDGADLSRASLRGAQLVGASLNGAKLSGADLSLADVREVDLSGTTGAPSSFDGARFSYSTKFPSSWSPDLIAKGTRTADDARKAVSCHAGARRSEEERSRILPEPYSSAAVDGGADPAPNALSDAAAASAAYDFAGGSH